MTQYREILERMQEKYFELSGCAVQDAADVGVRMKVLAGEICSLSTAVAWLRLQMFAQTATGKQLELHAQERGVTRKGALAATGILRFERAVPLWYKARIPAGTVCATEGEPEIRFVTLEDAVLPVSSLSVEVPAQAFLPGRSGNVGENRIVKLVTAPEGIQFVRNPAPFTGGVDAETDESLRARLLRHWRGIPNGANIAFYESVALRDEEIRSVQAVPRENGVGTVGLYAAGRAGPLSGAVAQRLQEELNAVREANVTVTVHPAKEVTVEVLLLIVPAEGWTLSRAREACIDGIRLYFDGLEVGETVLPQAICAKLFAIGAVRNCRPAAAFSGDRKMGKGELAVPGKITVSELVE